MKRIWIVAVIVALCVLMAVGCAGSMNKTEAADVMTEAAAAPQASAMAPAVHYDASYAVTENGSGEDLKLTMGEVVSSADAEARYGGRKMILNYEASLETDAFDSLLDALEQRLAAAEGYVQNSYVDGKKPVAYGDRGRTATLTLRVPADRVEAFFSDVKTMGTLLSERAYGDDVTAEYFDRETRLSVLEIQLERLKSILVQTDNLADVLALETEIARVTIEIEELTGELRRYDALIDYATVYITVREMNLREGPAATETVGERIAAGFSDSLYGVGAFFTDGFVWFVSSLPVLLVLGVLGLIVFLIIRGASKRRRAKKAAQKTWNQQDNLYEEKK